MESGPHIIGSPTQEGKVSRAEQHEAILRVACMYLLFEKETETAIRAALGSLAQERHDHFHTKEGKNDGSSFQECKNEICTEVTEILIAYKKPAIEFNQLTAEMLLTKFELNMAKSAGSNKVLISLKDKDAIDQAPILPDEILNQTKGMKIKV